MPDDSLDDEIMDDAGARRMLDILTDPNADPDDRAEAAVNLGPGLQTCEERVDWEDPTVYFSRDVYEEIDETFRRLHTDESTPDRVRRRILEAGVRCPRDWHDEAIRTAFESDDEDWRKTAVFAMGYVPGFEDEILETLRREELSEGLLRESIRAAGARAVDGAEPVVRETAMDPDRDKLLRMVAVEALASFEEESAERTLQSLTGSPDPDIAKLADWAARQWNIYHDAADDEHPDLGGF